MCGIAGIRDTSAGVNKPQITHMTDAIAHRGPDASGVWISDDETIGLGHRRLSIIDLSNGSDQPFTSASGNIKLVFNGEVYNYKALAEHHGIIQKTSGDTEVIAELLDKYGPRALSLLKGMFALAWMNLETGLLHLARDHAGIKPLYYTLGEGRLSFASELRAIESAEEGLHLSLSNLKEYLELGFFGKERTIYAEVHKVLPGQCLSYDGAKAEYVDYAQHTFNEKSYTTPQEAEAIFDSLMTQSVEDRLISDRATGVFLSGGTDSSLVTHYAAKVSAKKINSYCVQIANSSKDESSYAERVAKEIGTDHHTIILSEKNIKDEVMHVLNMLDEPFGDSSIIPTYVLTKKVSQDVTVALAGDGGDELFMGYGMHTWANRLDKIPIPLQRPLFQCFKQLGPKKDKDYSKYFNYRRRSDIAQNILSQEMGCFHRNEVARLIAAPSSPPDLVYDGRLWDIRLESAAELQSFLDFKNYLPDDLLTKVDRASMYNSMEVRVPFLDKPMVEFAYSLPEKLKHRGKTGKMLLKNVLAKHISKDLVYRQKWGFSIPLHTWLLQDFAYLIDDHLNPSSLARFSWIDADEVASLINRFRGGEHYVYMRLWLLIQLVNWMNARPDTPVKH